MKKCMLVGAVGMALAGVAFAASGATPRRSVSTFVSAQKAAVGAAGSAKRAEVLSQIRAGIATGDIDPRTVLFLIDENILPGSGSAVDLSGAGAPTEGVSTTPNTVYFDPYNTYTFTNFNDGAGNQASTSLISFLGQVNPNGIPFTNVDPEFGVADNTTMTEGDNNAATLPITFTRGGVAPTPPNAVSVANGINNVPPFMVIARASGLDAPNAGFTLGMNIIHDLSVPTGSAPLGTPDDDTRLKTDWYLTNTKTNQWWSPVSFTEGFVEDRMFFGGQNQGGVLGFFSDAGGFLTNFVSLGVLSGNFQIGQFYAPPRSTLFPFPQNEWFEIMAVLSTTPGSVGTVGQGAFIKTPESIANSFLDPRMALGQIAPPDGVAAGWVNTYPGLVDTFNGTTILTHSGVGVATTQFGSLAPSGGPFGLSTPLAAISLSGVQLGLGLDDNNDPLFQPDDAFTDDEMMAGAIFVKPSPLPDFIIPYVDDMELYFPGPIRVQTDRFFDATSSNAIVSTQQNTSTGLGDTQSVAQISVATDGLFREEYSENFPTFPQPVLGSLGADGLPFTLDDDPAVVTAQVRLFSTVQTGRAVRILDGALTGNFAATILLGATNPRAGIASSDGMVWIRQPNVGSDGVWAVAPGFDETAEGQDNLTQGDFMPASLWVPAPGTQPAGLAAGELDFNNQFTNVLTTASVVATGPFMDIKVEIVPNPGQDPKNPFDEGLMRVTINGTVLVNTARTDGFWLAGGASADEVQFWSSNNGAGLGNLIHVDDINLSGPLRVRPAGPAFVAAPKYFDGMELYNVGQSIGGQGDTPFLNLGSLADGLPTDNSRRLTIASGDTGHTNPVAGTMVCRYMVDTTQLAGGVFAVGDTVVLNYEELPLPFNTLQAQNINCPGVLGVSLPYVVRPFNTALGTAENQGRTEAGSWTLLTGTPPNPPVQPSADQSPEAYVPVAGDNVSLAYSITTAARWGGSGQASLVVNSPTTGATTPAVITGGNMLQLKSTFGIDGSLNNNPDFFGASALLPQVNSAVGVLGIPNQLASLSVDVYIESLNAAGDPDNAQAPRSRMSIPFIGAGANSGRITGVNFGGPNVNNDQTLQGPPVNPGAAIPAADQVSIMVSSGLTAPDTQFILPATPISVISGGNGLGNLLNKWITVVCTVDDASNWTLSIDDDRSGPNAPVVIATGAAIDAGLFGPLDPFNPFDTSNMDFFTVRQGRDVGSGGEPTPSNFRIRTLVNTAVVVNPQTSSADVTAPSNANKDTDYCFYETTAAPEFQISLPTDVPDLNAQIADADATGAFAVRRDLGGNNDVIAVVNRAYNSATNTVSGPLLFDPCPLNITSPINRFDLFDGPSADAVLPALPVGLLYTGRWDLDGQIGQAGTNNPPPAGGLGRIDGPARTPAVSYNDPTLALPSFPADPAPRQILVCQWGENSADTALGVDGFLGVNPRSRWFFDNVSLSQATGTVCGDPITPNGATGTAVGADDLAGLLTQWGGPGTADLTGDGVVNSSDLATLLTRWGPCP